MLYLAVDIRNAGSHNQPPSGGHATQQHTNPTQQQTAGATQSHSNPTQQTIGVTQLHSNPTQQTIGESLATVDKFVLWVKDSKCPTNIKCIPTKDKKHIWHLM